MRRLNSRIGTLVSLIAMLVLVVLPADHAAFAAPDRAQAKISINFWLENFVPTQVDSNGDQAAGEMITSGSGDATAAARIWERTTLQWRVSNPSDLKHFQAWIGKTI